MSTLYLPLRTPSFGASSASTGSLAYLGDLATLGFSSSWAQNLWNTRLKVQRRATMWTKDDEIRSLTDTSRSLYRSHHSRVCLKKSPHGFGHLQAKSCNVKAPHHARSHRGSKVPSPSGKWHLCQASGMVHVVCLRNSVAILSSKCSWPGNKSRDRVKSFSWVTWCAKAQRLEVASSRLEPGFQL